MKRKAVGGLAIMALLGVMAGCATGGGGDGGAMQAEFSQEILPLLTTNCAGCHGSSGGMAGVSLAFSNLAEAQQRDDAFWNRVRTALSSGRMPPPSAPRRPSDAERERLVEWIGENLIDG